MSKLLGVFGGARNAAIAGVVALVVGAGLFSGGYLLGSRNESRYQVREVTKTVYVPIKEIQEVQVRNVERERELERALEQNQVVVSGLRQRLGQLDADNRTLNASVVRLLNEAITSTDPTTNPRGEPTGETTTVTDLTNWSLDAIEQYNEVSTRYNSLIDWVEEELIEPQDLDR